MCIFSVAFVVLFWTLCCANFDTKAAGRMKFVGAFCLAFGNKQEQQQKEQAIHVISRITNL